MKKNTEGRSFSNDKSATSVVPKVYWIPMVDENSKKLVPICTDTGHNATKAFTVSLKLRLSFLQRSMATMFAPQWNGDEDMMIPLAHARDPNSTNFKGHLLYETLRDGKRKPVCSVPIGDRELVVKKDNLK